MLKCNVEQINDIKVIVLEGQISVMERMVLKNILDKEKNNDQRKYILDLSNVFYIDSFGVAFFQNLLAGGTARRSLIIVSAKEYIRYVIRFNKLDKMMNIEIVLNMESAIKRFQNKNTEGQNG